MTSSARIAPVADSRPLFTIAIPTFNRARLLERCLESALAQTATSFEVLISDNASEDDTADLLRRISDPRLVVQRQPRNIGRSATGTPASLPPRVGIR